MGHPVSVVGHPSGVVRHPGRAVRHKSVSSDKMPAGVLRHPGGTSNLRHQGGVVGYQPVS